MKAVFICLILIGAASLTHAAPSSLLLEPSVGFRSETVLLTDLSQNETKLKASSPVYGLKFGYRSPIGVDVNLAYDYSNGKMEVTGESDKSKFTHQTASAQLGINALGLMKIYLGYAFLNELNIDGFLTRPQFKLAGPAYLVGIQFKVFQYVNIGAQYNLNQFNQITGPAYALGDDTEKYFTKIDSQDYSINLSLDF